MITSLIAGLSILLLTGLTNSYISYLLFDKHQIYNSKKPS
ncbi:hypothetical protein Anacy_0217 [Anabaena cylindrica PCC 7122]|uniref:Uncharacterized protein n=1 Tax=Anabaena cylindrica (strain ATCC 27899 / PCC 7122) TaxID=272123 RepID=K9ZAR3_ANACC|nr:hypothetical protein Anacy_0217 [Anabaena cylindrica PCC 7122]BAY01754.1 hypothetical protein NIES19_09900 [Anabaena cylindrica PCC 7122]